MFGLIYQSMQNLILFFHLGCISLIDCILVSVNILLSMLCNYIIWMDTSVAFGVTEQYLPTCLSPWPQLGSESSQSCTTFTTCDHRLMSICSEFLKNLIIFWVWTCDFQGTSFTGHFITRPCHSGSHFSSLKPLAFNMLTPAP